MYSLEKVAEILNSSWNDKPDSYKFGLSEYYSMTIHTDGILPYYNSSSGNRVSMDMRNCPEYQYIFDNVLFSRHPRENEKIRNWRYSQYVPQQRDPFLRIISVVNASIFQDTNYSLTIEGKEDEGFVWDKTNSFFQQFSGLSKDILTDASGYIVVLPDISWGDPKRKVKPYLAFAKTPSIKIVTDDEFAFELGDIVWLINKVGYFRFAKNKKTGTYELLDADGYYAHLFNTLPIVVAGGIKNEYGFQSWLISGKPYADEFVSAKSAECLVNKEASHPFIIAAAEDCADCDGIGSISYCSECDNLINQCSCSKDDGKFTIPRLMKCSGCGGTGKQSRNPGDWMIVPKDDMGSDLIKIITPNISVNEHLKRTSDDIMQKLLAALHLSETTSSVSGIAKTKEMETRYQFILAICNDWFDRIIPQLLGYMLGLRNARTVSDVLMPYIPNFTLIKPTQFSIKNASDLLIEYQISSQAGMPQYIRSKQLEDYVDKHFGGDHIMAKTVRVINDLDMFAVDLPSELTSFNGSKEWQYHKQLPQALRALVRNFGDSWFIDADIDTIKAESDKLIVYTDMNIGTETKNLSEKNIMPIFGQGNSATKVGKSPTGTGFYDLNE